MFCASMALGHPRILLSENVQAPPPTPIRPWLGKAASARLQICYVGSPTPVKSVLRDNEDAKRVPIGIGVHP
jgi:hypothetical protein